MRVGGFFVLLVFDPNNPMSSQKMLPNAGVSRAASHAAATHRQISSAAARGLVITTTIQLLRAVDDRSDSIVCHGIEPGKN